MMKLHELLGILTSDMECAGWAIGEKDDQDLKSIFETLTPTQKLAVYCLVGNIILNLKGDYQ